MWLENQDYGTCKFGVLLPWECSAKSCKKEDNVIINIPHSENKKNLLNPKLIKSFVLLQPTSPFKTANEISLGVKMLSNANVQSVIGVCEVVNHPSDYLFINSNGKIENLITESKNKRRQECYSKNCRGRK